jgi:ABC-2 type transport system ATP-binding protein
MRAGKTTTVEIMEGLQVPTSGEVRILGTTWAQDPGALSQRIGVVLQEAHFFDRETVREILRLFASFFPRAESVQSALGMVALEPKADTLVMNLSGGQRQRLAIAAALIGRPELIFLDEPSTGLDPQSRAAIWEVIGRVKREGRTVLLTTHYMEEAESLCDMIYVFDKGRVIAQESPSEQVTRYGGHSVLEVHTTPMLTAEALAGLPGLVSSSRIKAGWHLLVTEPHVSMPALMTLTAARSARLDFLGLTRPTMNDVFLA